MARPNCTVMVKDGNIERAIKRLKTKITKLGVLKDYQESCRYEKRSDRRIRVLKANIINSKRKKRLREKDI